MSSLEGRTKAMADMGAQAVRKRDIPTFEPDMRRIYAGLR
jgi:hypothetical protein